jgi:hypothetical protein
MLLYSPAYVLKMLSKQYIEDGLSVRQVKKELDPWKIERWVEMAEFRSQMGLGFANRRFSNFVLAAVRIPNNLDLHFVTSQPRNIDFDGDFLCLDFSLPAGLLVELSGRFSMGDLLVVIRVRETSTAYPVIPLIWSILFAPDRLWVAVPSRICCYFSPFL